MPIYEYECKACNYKLEAFQNISELSLIVCPKCNKETLRKVISLSTFRVYGEGFHKPNKR